MHLVIRQLELADGQALSNCVMLSPFYTVCPAAKEKKQKNLESE
jgi:hypothetical protein